jgi:hypothetical protein
VARQHDLGIEREDAVERMSAAITVRASATQMMASPAVWAGPTSISSRWRPPTSSSSSPLNVRWGVVSFTSEKSNGASMPVT